MAQEDDDEFEDLFSFGASTPGASSTSDTAAKPPTSTGSDFDFLSDVSLSSSGAGGNITPGGAGSAIPRSTGGGGDTDDFDSIFGTPPVTPATPRTPMDLTADEKNSLLAIDETPEGGSKETKLQHQLSMDDFHVHDEDTRDMLDWLDDDTTGKKANDEPSKDITLNVSGDGDDVPLKKNEGTNRAEAEDDDFDFDQMLAEADATPSPQNSSTGNKKDTGDSKKQSSPSQQNQLPQPQVPAAVEKPSEDDATTKSKDVSNTSEIFNSPTPAAAEDDDSTPLPISKPSAIEDELAFDQWEDEEIEDLQVVDDANDGSNSQDGSTENAIEGATANETNASPGKKDGGVAAQVVVKPPSPKKVFFASLSTAIRSNAATIDDVRSLFKKERSVNNASGDVGVNTEDRAHLWTKVICNKILKDIEDGSLADSYREWEKKQVEEATAKKLGEEHGVMIDSLLKQGCGMDKSDADGDAYEAQKGELLLLSYFHSRNKSTSSASSSLDGIDPLIPPVAHAILQSGIPPAAASVVLSHIEPHAMPLLRLSHDERYLAAKALHADFYLLACYHLPLLVMHLDRHCPGWYWPRKKNVVGNVGEDEKPVDDNEEVVTNDDAKDGTEAGGEAKDQKAVDVQSSEAAESSPEKKKLEQNGLLPMSWFVTNFAGDCSGSGSCLDHKSLLPLWDNILTKGDHSWKYFLAIAVLEKHSDALLMARGEELKEELTKIMDFQVTLFAMESFVGAGSEGKAAAGANNGGDDVVVEWLSSAKSLIESTPSSVIELLRSADDRAVATALKVRQTKMDEELQAQLDADEAARRKERDERDMEAERALNKARLTAYYRTYNPEKVDTIDKILKLFDGRMEVLDNKLRNKYGKGFLPDEALKDQTRSFLMSVNQSISDTKKHVTVAVAERRKKKAKPMPESRSHSSVVLEVSTTEVIPVICTTKGHSLATGRKIIPEQRTSDLDAALQFYLVDCRPESIAAEQGRFPTAVTLSPEKLQDPDELQKLTDMFESLRGAVHICVMGEGFASFPVLYNHSLSKAEEKLLEDDIARTSSCALFFLKKGFPFVSVLRGGFAAAHAFLSRNGPPMGMTPPDVLIEYDPVVSLFGQLETARQEEDQYKTLPAREKTTRTLQKIIDNSMTRLTIEEHRINNLANDLAKPETVVKMKQSASNFLAKAKSAKPIAVPTMSFGRTPPLFMAKKFASTKTDDDPTKKAEPAQEEHKDKKPVASFTDKMNFKMPSLHSASSGIALSDKDNGVDQTETNTASGSEPPQPPSSVPTLASANNETTQESSSDSPSKVSSAFASLTQRIQQSTTAAASAADSGEPILEGNPAKKESAIGVSKISFSSFTNRIKLSQPTTLPPKAAEDKVTDTEVSKEKNDTPEETATDQSSDQENNEDSSSDSPSKVTSAFASLTQRIQQPEGNAARKEGNIGISKVSLSSFTNRMKLSPLSSVQPSNWSVNAAEVKVSEDKEVSTSQKSEEEEPKMEPKSEEEPKTAGISTNNPADGGRFTQFTKSIGGSLSVLREKAAETKVAEEKKDPIPDENKNEEVKTPTGTAAAADGGRFTQFTKSIGGRVSELRNQPTRQNPFAGLMSSKPDSTDPTKTAEGDGDSVSKAMSSLAQSSFGKMLLEDEPLPQTRFQRLEAEESISFGDETDDATPLSTGSREGDELNDDTMQDLLFADVSLTDVSLSDDGDGDKEPDEKPVKEGDTEPATDGDKEPVEDGIEEPATDGGDKEKQANAP